MNALGYKWNNRLVRQHVKWMKQIIYTEECMIGGYHYCGIFTQLKSKSHNNNNVRRQLCIKSPEEAGITARQLAYEVLKKQKTSKNIQHMDSILAHTGIESNDNEYNIERNNNNNNKPMSPPLHVSTTYTRPVDGIYKENDSTYIRQDNPTRLQLEYTMFQLETHGGCNSTTEEYSSKGDNCMSFAYSSGMMAASSIILAHETPLNVILPIDLYHGVRSLLFDVFTRFQVSVEYIDIVNDNNEVESRLQKCIQAHSNKNIIVWIETPSNPLCHVIDITAICQKVQKINKNNNNNITIVVDSTLAPPIITQPLLLGADIVMHSATKYLGGHSDAMCGIVTASPYTTKGNELYTKLKQVQTLVGGVASTFDTWLIMRGMRTLQIRVETQSNTALQIALYLYNHKHVMKVYYPGLPSNMKQYEIAKRQMMNHNDTSKQNLYGGVLSFEMENEYKAYAFIGALQLINRATSLGGTETLIEHRYSIEPPSNQTSPKGLLRVSIGLENPIDLINDLEFAFTIVDEMFHE